MNDLIASIDILAAPIVLFLAITLKQLPMTFRLAIGVFAFGLFFQAFVVFTDLDQLSGWGYLWAVKDLAGLIIAIRGIVLIFGGK